MLIVVSYYLFLLIAWSTIVLWLTGIVWTRSELNAQKSFCQTDLPRLTNAPRVSILLPVRNEESRILSVCARSLLAQTYSNFEIIAVNDRSTDGSGGILRDLSRLDERLQVVEGIEIPAGWLGKPFVLQQALTRSNGEWILTVDADLVFAPDAVKNAVAFAAANELDALCLIPFVSCETFWEKIFMPTFNWLRILAMPPRRVNDPARAETMGIGNFFLMRRAALDKIGGLEIVKNDVAEDLRLAALLKASGAKIRTESAPDLLMTRMYAGFGEIWHGFTKNLFAGSDFSIVKTLGGAVSIMLFGVLPVASAAFFLVVWLAANETRAFWLFVPPVIIYILQITLFVILHRVWRQPLVLAVFAPLGLGLFAVIMLNSAIKILTGRGVVWKGREIYKRGRETALPQILENK